MPGRPVGTLREVAGDRQLVAIEPQVAVIGGIGVERAVAQARA